MRIVSSFRKPILYSCASAHSPRVSLAATYPPHGLALLAHPQKGKDADLLDIAQDLARPDSLPPGWTVYRDKGSHRRFYNNQVWRALQLQPIGYAYWTLTCRQRPKGWRR